MYEVRLGLWPSRRVLRMEDDEIPCHVCKGWGVVCIASLDFEAHACGDCGGSGKVKSVWEEARKVQSL